MKTLIISAFLALTVNLSFAATTVLECSFADLSESGTLEVSLTNFDQPEQVRLNYELFTNPFDGGPAAFSYSGEELEWLWYLALSMDGQTVSLDARGNMSFFFDADGCDIGQLYLYGNNGFRFGYLKVAHYCSGYETEHTYSTARCRIK